MKLVLCVPLLAVAALATPAEAQLLCALGPTTKPYDATADVNAPANVQADLKKLKSLLCQKECGKVLLVANPTAPNAVTATNGLGVTQIAFSPKFLAAVRAAQGPSGMIGIVAHELGHHIDAIAPRPAWMGSKWDPELRADAWAGCALGKADLKPPAVEAALAVMAAYPPAAHTAWATRRPAVEVGYAECTGGHSLPEPPKKVTATETSAAPGGCSSDKECRNGRVCLAGRCELAPTHRRCGKDTDCPDPQECGADGYCQTPPGAAPPAAPPKPAKAAKTQAAAPEPPPEPKRAAPPAPDPAACQKGCDDARDKCVEAATATRTQCLSAIEGEPNYHTCTCPRYPEGNYSCYQYCTDAYQRGNTCLGEKKTAACQSDDASCRAQCGPAGHN